MKLTITQKQKLVAVMLNRIKICIHTFPYVKDKDNTTVPSIIKGTIRGIQLASHENDSIKDAVIFCSPRRHLGEKIELNNIFNITKDGKTPLL